MTGIDPLRALEAVRTVAAEFGFPSAELRACFSFLLSGNVIGARHSCAFTIAIECRRLGRDKKATERVLRRWARAIGYRGSDGERGIRSAVKSAFALDARGGYKYRPPGRPQKFSPRYREALLPICEAVGCPSHCPAFSGRRRSEHRHEDFERFTALGWPEYCRQRRFPGAVETYRAVCEREAELERVPGEPFYVNRRQLAERGGTPRSEKAVGRHLGFLAASGLMTDYEAGSRRKGKRSRGSRIARAVPIPAPPLYPHKRPGDVTSADIGDVTSPNRGDVCAEAPIYRGRELEGEAGVLAEVARLVAEGVLVEVGQ